MKTIHRLAAGALAGAAVLTFTAPAGADTPYAQASALVAPDGSLENGTNIIRAWRVGAGDYCVAVDPSVNLEETQAVHATPAGHNHAVRVLSVHVGAPMCGDWRVDVIGVHSRDVRDRGRDTAFYLTVS
ncbi:hypothetical protein ACIBP6_15070 [Nonomuraea terrae]|uniref:hypothetical protein n=1 Tax=Nonomuraea terrae TaxID=2530383 RepID=UPI00378EE635